MVHYDGEYELEIGYDVSISSRAFPHSMTFDLNIPNAPSVGALFSDIDLQQRDGGVMTLQAFVDAFSGFFDPLMGTGTSQPSFTLWRYDLEPSLVKNFVAAGTLTAPITYSGTSQAAQSIIITFRTQFGNTARIYLMEPITALETRVSGGAITGDTLSFINFIIDNDSPVLGRDGAPLVAAIAVNYGQNEALRRKRFRSV